MRVRALFAALLGASLITSSPAQADTGCSFTVNDVGISWDGWLNVNVTTGGVTRYWWICNISGTASVNFGNGQTGNINAESCRGMYTNFLTAFASNKQIGMWFLGINDCTAASLPADGMPARSPINIWL